MFEADPSPKNAPLGTYPYLCAPDLLYERRKISHQRSSPSLFAEILILLHPESDPDSSEMDAERKNGFRNTQIYPHCLCFRVQYPKPRYWTGLLQIRLLLISKEAFLCYSGYESQALFYQISAYLPYKLFPKSSVVLVTFTTYIYAHYKDSFHTLLPPNPF